MKKQVSRLEVMRRIERKSSEWLSEYAAGRMVFEPGFLPQLQQLYRISSRELAIHNDKRNR